MALNISDKDGVSHTEGTSMQINGGGKIKIDGGFKNTGDVKIDTGANLEILGGVVNAGTFSIKDYVAEDQYRFFEQAINDLQGDAQKYLRSSYQDLKSGNTESANSWFKKFTGYIQQHPELITSSVQIVLQLFSLVHTNTPTPPQAPN